MSISVRFPKEAELQHFFYVGLLKSLPPHLKPLSEISAILPTCLTEKRKLTKGSLDFYVNNELGYALELLRLNSKFAEHKSRFMQDGKDFTPMIKDHRLVNFVSRGHPSNISDQNLINVYIYDDCSGAELERGGKTFARVIFGGNVGESLKISKISHCPSLTHLICLVTEQSPLGVSFTATPSRKRAHEDDDDIDDEPITVRESRKKQS